ncbi:MAG: aquaporin [Acidobacteria bacterium]|nr:aquaporin [Acidobacteriota bacterium]
MLQALRHHWPEYLMEAAGLGFFMVSAGIFTTLLEYPGSPLHQFFASDLTRRALIGLAMGLTAFALIYSPWGQQSGAHYNPAVTLSFALLGKVRLWDTVFYITAQILGGVAGVLLVSALLGEYFRQPPISFVVTVPGAGGVWAAFAGEAAISFGLMWMVLWTGNTLSLSRYTGLLAGAMICIYITFEAPLSGMSMNPARSLASALPSGIWGSMWVYFTAPVIGMLLAVETSRFLRGRQNVLCAKLYHQNKRRCIFCGAGIQGILVLLMLATAAARA